MKRHILTIAMLTAIVATSACNTVRGAGRDVQSVGNAVEKTTH